MDRHMRAALVAEVQALREHTETLLQLLLPDEEVVNGCPHPADKVEVERAMGEEDAYRCTLCGAEQTQPFHE